MKGNLLLLAAAFLAVEAPLFSQEETKAGKSDRNVMLNAESASVPREINIGLPESGDGAALLVDGIKHAYGLPKSQFHWSGGNAYCRGGLSYDNSWMDVTALVSFITSWNNAKVMTVSDHATGETIPWTAQYGIRTLGFILDGNVHFGGFKLHLMGTWQDPRYKDYRNEFNFGSGVKVLDYSGKLVTGISQFMAEIDPSFSWDRYCIWSSIRYYSRQYASRNNLAWFDGHFETFAGCEAWIDAHNRVALNLVNALGVGGAKGSVDFIDTLEDGSLLVNRLISGKYIRPFCVELSYTLAF